MRKTPASPILLALVILLGSACVQARGADLLIGSTTVDITPTGPVALAGQFHTRISQKVETPLKAAAIAIEARDGEKSLDQAIMIGCDLVAIRDGVQEQFRKKLAPRLAGFDVRKVFLSATHTHTGPVCGDAHILYEIPEKGVVQPQEYVDFLVERLCDAAVKAWESRKPGGISWTLGHAVVGHNRRPVYADGTARLYGPSTGPTFRGLEGYEDHSVNMLFFWNAEKKLQAIAINIACTAQEVENRNNVNADYWHEVRQQLANQLANPDLCVLGWISAAGDQSPHLIWDKKAEERMRTLRGLTPMEEIARKISNCVADTMEIAKKDIRTGVPFTHNVKDIELPRRKITPAEYETAKAAFEKWSKKPTLTSVEKAHMAREKDVIDRYDKSAQAGPYAMELHALRIGDIAIATNPFELFLDYGIQIKGRSPAMQTFVVQLACNSGVYLPTQKAIAGGSYSVTPHSNVVGPEGGQILVDKTVQAIEELFRPGSERGAR